MVAGSWLMRQILAWIVLTVPLFVALLAIDAYRVGASEAYNRSVFGGDTRTYLHSFVMVWFLAAPAFVIHHDVLRGRILRALGVNLSGAVLAAALLASPWQGQDSSFTNGFMLGTIFLGVPGLLLGVLSSITLRWRIPVTTTETIAPVAKSFRGPR